MNKLFNLFKSDRHHPEFEEKAEELRQELNSKNSYQLLELLIEVSKVWNYDFDERKDLMQELFDRLPKRVQEPLISYLSEKQKGFDVSSDIPYALSQAKKDELQLLLEMISNSSKGS